jgi:hypothetical protein
MAPRLAARGYALSLLMDRERLEVRAEVARGALAPLVASLRSDMDRLLQGDRTFPAEKALLSREGGRCARDGMLLAFDPFRPHRHVCPLCGLVYEGERHDLWWVMSRQLWLAERCVHAAALWAVTRDEEMLRLADGILRDAVARYATYPNRDNVLGPSRPFFSTYLESIWLLQLAIALDLLETAGATGLASGEVRDRVLDPSLDLIASFDEGDSNRQVWNNAAMLAAGQLTDRSLLVRRAVNGSSGLTAHLEGALLPDGTWYEGENYHLFAHRGLWYGVVMAEQAGMSLPDSLRARFDEGFAAPLATALPDFTFPARRDAQYGVSLRNWRFAESCELGLARVADPRLTTALGVLYSNDLPRGDTGRWRSAAEAERTEPATALSRADLSWKAILYACADPPVLPKVAPSSILLEEQGIAVFRRDAGRTYAALDYGQTGGPHGHPDRLNLLLATGNSRWLDDMGTGSYVDPSLHWYRSTLAHNAPLADGRSQAPGAGTLLAHEERGAVGWVDATLAAGLLAPDVSARRTLIMMPDYMIDRLEWHGPRPVVIDLPWHLDPAIDGAAPWRPRVPAASDAPSDGFAYLSETESAPLADGALELTATIGDDLLSGWCFSSGSAELWRGVAPSAPGQGQGSARFLWLRLHDRDGAVTTVWSWSDSVTGAAARDGVLHVQLADGERHEHTRDERRWHIDLFVNDARSGIDLAGVRRNPRRETPPPMLRALAPATIPRARRPRNAPAPLHFELGEREYRRSEQSWQEAGMPRAAVELSASADELTVDISVRKAHLFFRPGDAQDPALDNEHPDIHSDGIEFFLLAPGWDRAAAWLMVPEAGGKLRVHTVDGSRAGVALRASWEPADEGFDVHLGVVLAELGNGPDYPLSLDVIVNDMAAGRQRRRGQLVLSGGAGEFIYLQGDRQAPSRYLHFVIPRG